MAFPVSWRPALCNVLRSYGQPAKASSGSRENRVGNGGGERRNGSFADTAGIVLRLHDVDIDLRHLVDAEHFVGIEVPLLHAAFVDSDRAFERGGEPVYNAAFNLLGDDGGIDDMSAIDRAGDTVDLQFSLIDGD